MGHVYVRSIVPFGPETKVKLPMENSKGLPEDRFLTRLNVLLADLSGIAPGSPQWYKDEARASS